MDKPSAKDDSLTTLELSKMLGLDVGTIQAMFNSGELKGWKTPGGHRRISKASVQEWLTNRSTTMPGQTPQVAPQSIGLVKTGLKVLIIEDSVRYQTVLRTIVEQTLPQVQLIVCGDAYNGLIEFGRHSPDLLLLDLLLPGVDGFAILGSLTTHQQLSGCKVVVVSSMSPEELKPYSFILSGLQSVNKAAIYEQLPQVLSAYK